MANEILAHMAQTTQQLNWLEDQAIEVYETREALELVVQALEDIVQVPNKIASDSRAIKEIIKIAREALDQVVEE